MKRQICIALSATVLTLSACGKTSDPANETVATGENSVVAAEVSNSGSEALAPVTQGQTFANTAASSDAFEIETSKLAETNGSSAKVKKFAQEMIKAHTDSMMKLKAAASAATPAITPLPALTATQQQVVDGLKGKTGAAFDATYIEAQKSAHQATLDTLKSYAQSGEVASLKNFASSLVPIVTGHLNMANGLKP